MEGFVCHKCVLIVRNNPVQAKNQNFNAHGLSVSLKSAINEGRIIEGTIWQVNISMCIFLIF